MTLPLKRALIAAALMLASALGAWALSPRHMMVDRLGRLNLEASIPPEFGPWALETRPAGYVVNPQQTELLGKLYGQTLTRTYVNRATGQAVMLSMAYGEDQRDGMQMHYPEVCYPAQGFELRSNHKAQLTLAGIPMPVRQLETLGPGGQRPEPVTYWTVVGGTPTLGGNDKKFAEMRHTLRGEIPDGFLFRVSSIDADSNRAFELHRAFMDALLASPGVREKLRIDPGP